MCEYILKVKLPADSVRTAIHVLGQKVRVIIVATQMYICVGSVSLTFFIFVKKKKEKPTKVIEIGVVLSSLYVPIQ